MRLGLRGAPSVPPVRRCVLVRPVRGLRLSGFWLGVRRFLRTSQLPLLRFMQLLLPSPVPGLGLVLAPDSGS